MTEDPASIKIVTDLFHDGGIGRDLAYTDLSISIIEKGIRKLETAGMPLRESLDVE